MSADFEKFIRFLGYLGAAKTLDRMIEIDRAGTDLSKSNEFKECAKNIAAYWDHCPIHQ